VLTEKECLEALKDMESAKTPGTDGLPTRGEESSSSSLRKMQNPILLKTGDL